MCGVCVRLHVRLCVRASVYVVCLYGVYTCAPMGGCLYGVLFVRVVCTYVYMLVCYYREYVCVCGVYVRLYVRLRVRTSVYVCVSIWGVCVCTYGGVSVWCLVCVCGVYVCVRGGGVHAVCMYVYVHLCMCVYGAFVCLYGMDVCVCVYEGGARVYVYVCLWGEGGVVNNARPVTRFVQR